MNREIMIIGASLALLVSVILVAVSGRDFGFLATAYTMLVIALSIKER